MQVRREVAHRRGDARVERATVRQVPAEAHAGRADPAGALAQPGEEVDAQPRVVVVGRELLFDLPGVAGVGAGAVVGERRRACELVVGRRRGDNVAVRGELPAQPRDGAGDLVDLGEEDNPGEAGARVAGDGGVEEEDAFVVG